MVLVTGFGPFEDVDDNPAERLARAVDARRVRGETVVGRVLPVSFERAPALTLAFARLHAARLVVGLGVATSRRRAEVERLARRVVGDRADVDGAVLDALHGPPEVRATVELGVLAGAMGLGTSEDAGAYVCNAWLYRVASALDVPVGFIHLPRSGLDPETLLEGIAALLQEPAAAR